MRLIYSVDNHTIWGDALKAREFFVRGRYTRGGGRWVEFTR